MPRRNPDGLIWPVPHEAMRFAGYRAMRELAAQRPEDPVGYGALGMYLFSHAVWLAQEMRRGGFDRIVFLARDGFFVKQAYDLVAPAMGISIPSDYVRISRQAAFPLHFPDAAALARLPDWIDALAHSPKTLTALLMPVLAADLTQVADRAQEAITAADIAWTERLTEDSLPRFIAACQNLFDADKAAEYRDAAAAYLTQHFTGRCATFDVGYNLRSESVICDLTGADLTAFITHTDSDVPDLRGVAYRTLYGRSPYVSWVAREQFLLEDAPLCTGYDGNGPVLTEACTGPDPGIKRCQQAAMAFVSDMVRTHWAGLEELTFRPADGCAAFEHFLHRGPYRLMKPFRAARVENGFHAGAAGEDGAFLQWRLMQTDLQAALGAPGWWIRVKRALIRLREEPAAVIRKLRR